MATSYADIARSLLDKGSQQFPSKSTAFDRVYVENKSVDRRGMPGKVQPRFKFGDVHPLNEFLFIVDCYITGADDHFENWSLIYRLDLDKWAEANPDEAGGKTGEQLQANSNTVVTFPYEDSSQTIQWTLSIVNPDAAPAYAKPAQGTPHPTVPDALFINEQWQRDGALLTVTRSYVKVAEVAEQGKIGYMVQWEYPDYPVVTWTFDCAKGDFTPPAVEAACPINNSGSLDFSALQVIRPAQLQVLNGLNVRVTITYGLLPGPLISVPSVGEGPAGDVVVRSRRQSITAGNPAGPWLNFQTGEDNGYSKVWNWVTLASNPIFRDYDIDQETRETITITRQIISLSGGSGDVPTQSVGGVTTQQQLNEFYALRTRRSISGTPADIIQRMWVNFRIPSVVQNGGIVGSPSLDGLTWRINIVSKGGYMKKLRAYERIEFSNSLPAIQNIYEIIPSSQVYNGEFFSFNLSGRLVDGMTVGSTGPAYSETVDVVATSPTATQYINDVASGAPQRIAEETVRYWTGHYRRSSIYVYLEI